METGLRDRAAVISGGSKGIGKAIARALAQEGVNVALLACTESEVKVAAAEIEAETGVTALGVAADITDTASLKEAVTRLSAEPAFRTVNIVVNNAAGPITSMERQIEWPDEEWTAAIDVKTVGALRVIREFLPLLAMDGTGRVINVAGASGIAVWNPALLHGINNAAIIYMTGFMAADLAASRITVNAIIPGLVGTEYRQDWAKQLGEQQGKSGEAAIGALCQAKGILPLLKRWSWNGSSNIDVNTPRARSFAALSAGALALGGMLGGGPGDSRHGGDRNGILARLRGAQRTPLLWFGTGSCWPGAERLRPACHTS